MKSPKFTIVYFYEINGNQRASIVTHGNRSEWSKPVAIKHAIDFAKRHNVECRVISSEDGAYTDNVVFTAKVSKAIEFEHAELLMLKGILDNESMSLTVSGVNTDDANEKAAYLGLWNALYEIRAKVAKAIRN